MSILSRSQLADPDRVRLEEYLCRFQENWSSDSMQSLPAAFEQYLPGADDPLRAYVLFEVITMDMTSRWRIGQKVRIEFYLSAFPELAAEPDRVVALIYEEYRTRALMQEPVAVNAYQERFPEYFEHFYRFVRSQVGAGETAVTDTIKAQPPPSKRATTPAPEDGKSFVPDFSRYEFVKRLGAGQFGEVWLAKAPGGVDVALKIIPWPSAHKMSQMELRALEVMKRLRHAFLIQVHAYWPMEDQVAIVMELADGSLEDRLGEARATGEIGVPREELIEYMFESAEALDHLHNQNVLHRDIKPANILIVEGHAKLGDFGVARLVNAEQPADLRATCVGTPHFMAPEVWDNKVQPNSDQYSLAVTYVELRIGRPVFVAESLGELLRSHTTATPDLDPIPALEQQIILKALAKRPEDRYASCTEFIQSLRDMVAAEHHKEATKGEVRRRRIIIGTILGLAACAAAIPFFIIRPSEPIEPTLDLPSEVQLGAGGSEMRFMIGVVAPDSEGTDLNPDDLTITGLPETVNMEITPLEDQNHKLAIRLNAQIDAPQRAFPIQVQLAFGEVELAGEFSLIVSQPDVYTLPNTKPAPGAELVEAEGDIYWSRIHWDSPESNNTPGGIPIEFVLIPRTNSTDPPTFYMMQNKVWNGLFEAFVDANPKLEVDKPLDGDQNAGDSSRKTWTYNHSSGYAAKDFPLRPVFYVNVRIANEFAKWFGGSLPTLAQWNKASGFYDRANPAYAEFSRGPFRGTQDAAPGDFAIMVGDSLDPMDVGTAKRDESCFGVRDMAGNGFEFTSEVRTHLGTYVNVDADFNKFGVGHTLVTTGNGYVSTRPKLYPEFDEEGGEGWFNESDSIYTQSSQFTFRIILPLPIKE